MKKMIINAENPNGITVDFNAEEIAEKEIDLKNEAELLLENNNEATAQATLKASAKAKLIAGEALTEAEANTIVL